MCLFKNKNSSTQNKNEIEKKNTEDLNLSEDDDDDDNETNNSQKSSLVKKIDTESDHEIIDLDVSAKTKPAKRKSSDVLPNDSNVCVKSAPKYKNKKKK